MRLVNVFWFRRDLRLEDNTGLSHALSGGLPVLPLFIFDTEIISELPSDDPRITFIHETLRSIDAWLRSSGSSLLVLRGDPKRIWEELVSRYQVNAVYTNRDYEPYAISRDAQIESFLNEHDIKFYSYRDQVIFEGRDVLKSDGEPYTVFTPYRNAWRKKLTEERLKMSIPGNPNGRFIEQSAGFPSLESLPRKGMEPGFRESSIRVKPFDTGVIGEYHKYRDYPAADRTSYLGPHLRFGTVSIRKIVKAAMENEVFLGELIWREFFMQILFNFPHVVNGNFRSKYDNIAWRNNEEEFKRWCDGETGYPIVDAGMKQLNQTGFMHNRVRMITAAFLCKHLLIDWRWGEAYFATKLLDYELASNNGNWQWSAGTGCDAAPYFRVFNPALQQRKFDPDSHYLDKWVPERNTSHYPKPVVSHELARERAISTYREGLK
jgi:deoxyribodipyrimidine photo-lyase